jgi:hypothetical protein
MKFYSPIEVYQLFEETYCLCLQGQVPSLSKMENTLVTKADGFAF